IVTASVSCTHLVTRTRLVSFTSSSSCCPPARELHSFPTRRSSDLSRRPRWRRTRCGCCRPTTPRRSCSRSSSSRGGRPAAAATRSEEHTSELQSRSELVCRLLLEKKKNALHHLEDRETQDETYPSG